MNSKRLLNVVVTSVVCVGIDQLTKLIAKRTLAEGELITLLGDGVRLQLAKNYGTFLSLGASLPEGVRTAATTTGVGVILAALLGYAVFSKTANSVAVFAMAMLFGGGLSNLFDRIAYGGYVLDFLNVGIGPLRTGIFNVADMFIMAGVFVMLFSEPIQRRIFKSDRPAAT
jgi:signal peptidase II